LDTTATATFVAGLPALATGVATQVSAAAIVGVTVGLVVYGIRKVWGAFRSM